VKALRHVSTDVVRHVCRHVASLKALLMAGFHWTSLVFRPHHMHRRCNLLLHMLCVPWSVCVYVGHTSELCKNSRTKQDGVWRTDSYGHKELYIRLASRFLWKGALLWGDAWVFTTMLNWCATVPGDPASAANDTRLPYSDVACSPPLNYCLTWRCAESSFLFLHKVLLCVLPTLKFASPLLVLLWLLKC